MCFTQHVKIPRKMPVVSKILLRGSLVWNLRNVKHTFFIPFYCLMAYMTFLYNSFWRATSLPNIEMKSIEGYCVTRVAYFYQNVDLLLDNFMRETDLSILFTSIEYVDGKNNEKLLLVDHFFGMQSFKIFIFVRFLGYYWD